METEIASGGIRLWSRLSRPARPFADPAPALVLCHGFPRLPAGSAAAGQGFPELADRLAAEAGWTVISFNFRGCGPSGGDFSLGGWVDDIGAVIDHLSDAVPSAGVWLAGAGTGGSVAICRAAEDERVRGVAGLGVWPGFDAWAAEPEQFLGHAREVGAIRSPQFPPDLAAWSRELSEIRPLSAVGKITPRALLLVHGADDQAVPVEKARALADAALGHAELRVLTGASHQLRHDPRAFAVLLGWLDRQTSRA